MTALKSNILCNQLSVLVNTYYYGVLTSNFRIGHTLAVCSVRVNYMSLTSELQKNPCTKYIDIVYRHRNDRGIFTWQNAFENGNPLFEHYLFFINIKLEYRYYIDCMLILSNKITFDEETRDNLCTWICHPSVV